MQIFLAEAVPELPDKTPRWTNISRVIPRYDEGFDWLLIIIIIIMALLIVESPIEKYQILLSWFLDEAFFRNN